MLNSGWTSFKPNAGRVTLGDKISQLGATITKASENKFVVQSTDLHTDWVDVTPVIAEGLAYEIADELRKTNKQRLFRIKEV